MIHYERGGINFFLGVFQRRGSVFGSAAAIALPCAILTCILKSVMMTGIIRETDIEAQISDSTPWSGFSVLVGFLIIFRTSQAYSRFWDGCHAMYMMKAEWFDACSSIVAFTRNSEVPREADQFRHLLVRLFSMLHALALSEIEDSNSDAVEEVNAFSYELIDIHSIDGTSLSAIKESDSKVELVFQWIQQLLVEHTKTGVLDIPAPLLSRSFQELASGMVHFHDALKISTIPFPFPYAQTCDCLLLLHWVGTPFVMSQWIVQPWWAFLLSFVQVFILWCLNCIAVEIENPFGDDDNDIDAAQMQLDMNRHLLVLIASGTRRSPHLVKQHNDELELGTTMRGSFSKAWSHMGGETRRSCRSSYHGGSVPGFGKDGLPGIDEVPGGRQSCSSVSTTAQTAAATSMYSSQVSMWPSPRASGTALRGAQPPPVLNLGASGAEGSTEQMSDSSFRLLGAGYSIAMSGDFDGETKSSEAPASTALGHAEPRRGQLSVCISADGEAHGLSDDGRSPSKSSGGFHRSESGFHEDVEDGQVRGDMPRSAIDVVHQRGPPHQPQTKGDEDGFVNERPVGI